MNPRTPQEWGDGRKNEVAFDIVIDDEITVGLAKRAPKGVSVTS